MIGPDQNETSPRQSKYATTLKPALLFAILVLGGVAVYTSSLVVKRQHALSLVARYNITWDASQTLAELLRLETAIASYPGTTAGGSKDEVQLRLAIVANRVGLLTAGQVDAVLEREPDLKSAVEDLRAAVETIGPLVDDIEKKGRSQEALSLLTPLNTKMARLAAVANLLGAERVAADQAQLSRLHWIFSGILGCLFICSFGLVIFLLRQIGLLGRAQRKLYTLTDHLRRTGAELLGANQAIQEKNSELELQNQTLQDRDRDLRIQNERFDAALNNMSQGLCLTDADARIIVCNRRFASLFGLPPGFAGPGSPIAEVVRLACNANPREEALLKRIAGHQTALAEKGEADDFAYEGETGRVLAILQRPMLAGGWVATYEDVTERRRAEERIRHMAHHDALTNLPNRVLFRETLDQALTPMNGPGIAVLMLDLDFFKDINDTLGHPAGDRMLAIVGQRLRNCVHQHDVVARLGGDEFAVLQMSVLERSQAAALGTRIVDVLQAPYELDGHRVTVTASVGIALAPADGDSSDQLIQRADMALYNVKAGGRATHGFFEAAMEADVHERRQLGLEMREALTYGHFEVYYQPIVSLDSRRPTGFEALVRWRHPEHGLIPPSRFIPLAEEMGLIVALGEWILVQACAECATWPQELRVSVNLSARQFSDSLIRTVEQALRSSELSPERLDLEVTESVLLQENETNLATLFKLRALGIKIALDDFGTGYASLSYLSRFPFDKIKVDRSFISGMVESPVALAIVQSIADLAPKLGMKTIAEGIESSRLLEWASEAGCTEGQGYYFGRPMRKADIGHYLSSAANAFPAADPSGLRVDNVVRARFRA